MFLTKKKVLTEANSGVTAKYIVDAIIDANHEPIGCDINQNTVCSALGFESFITPEVINKNFWETMLLLIEKHQITDVIPTLDDTLLGWSLRKKYFKDAGCVIHTFPSKTLEVFLDKWRTFNFFKENEFPTPNTSLENIYPLTKPRNGRGATGIELNNTDREMTGLISQEVCIGQEFTIDVFVYNNKPLYIVPRSRDYVVNGKSTVSTVLKQDKIENYIYKLCEKIEFHGGFNLQCFINGSDIKFTELNPRFGGGTALAFAATENWIQILLNGLPEGWVPKNINYGLKMTRFYNDYFSRTM
jgi:carbamoyl-phosphate synthase large subunit